MQLGRVKWSYLNDMVYFMYFYFMFFAFCQVHSISAKQQQHYASIIFAILVIILGIAYLIALSVLIIIKNNQGKIFSEDETDANLQPYRNEYRCFVANLKPKSTNIFGLMSQPIRYFEKLLISISFAYCSNY